MSKYPVPNRTSMPTKAEWDDSVELGRGFLKFNDGRPAKVEIWAEDGYTFNTYFFSTMDIDNISFGDLMGYMRAQGIRPDANIQEGRVGLRKHLDGNGNELWSVTIVIGEPYDPEIVDDDWYLQKYGYSRDEFHRELQKRLEAKKEQPKGK